MLFLQKQNERGGDVVICMKSHLSARSDHIFSDGTHTHTESHTHTHNNQRQEPHTDFRFLNKNNSFQDDI